MSNPFERPPLATGDWVRVRDQGDTGQVTMQERRRGVLHVYVEFESGYVGCYRRDQLVAVGAPLNSCSSASLVTVTRTAAATPPAAAVIAFTKPVSAREVATHAYWCAALHLNTPQIPAGLTTEETDALFSNAMTLLCEIAATRRDRLGDAADRAFTRMLGGQYAVNRPGMGSGNGGGDPPCAA